MDTTAYKDGLRGWLRAVDAEDLSFSGKPAAHGIAVEGDAVVAKDKGNDWFKKRDYGKAVEWYTRSLQLDPLSAITVANRAMAHLQLKDYATAEADSEQAIALDATYVKAYMRRGTARKALGKLDLALEDFETVMRLEKENKQAAQEVALLRQAVAAAKKGEGERAKENAKEQTHRRAEKEEQMKHEPMKSEDAERKRTQHDREKRAEDEESHKNGEKRPFNEAAKPTSTVTTAVAGNVQEEAKQPSLSSSTILPLSSAGTKFAPAVTLDKPKTAFDFEKAWSNIKDDTAAFWNYFLLLEPKSYASFFGNSMTPAIISSILAALMQHGLGEHCVAQSLDVLRHLPSIRRWKIILKKEDREVLGALFDRMLAQVAEGKSGGVARDAVQEVRALYAL